MNDSSSLFTQYFYFKKGTPAFEHWRTHRRARGGVAARDVGKYNAYGEEAWNDEVLVGDETGKPDKIVEQLVAEEGREEDFVGTTGEGKLAGLKRRTESDEKNDTRSLERSLTRTLYLLVKTKQNQDTWRFPSGALEGKESLKNAAQRVLTTSCGPNMNTFIVGNHPVGHYVENFSSPQPSQKPSQDTTTDKTSTSTSSPPSQKSTDTASSSPEPSFVDGEKTFFMKARIMRGQVDLSSAEMKDVVDYQWVGKDEIEALVGEDYWVRVRNMLVAQ
jgi:large subunit ribosomal protein L46